MRGLVNLGNTCYFNTAVQCLAHCPALSKYLFFNEYTGPCNITREYQKVAKQLFLSGESSPVNPSALLSEFRTKFSSFANTGQHDAQEVIVCLIDVFEKSLGKDLIKDIFNGEETQETVFPGGSSNTTETFTTLILDVNSDSKLETILENRWKHAGISDYVDETGRRHRVAAVGRKVTRWPKVIGFTFSMYNSKFQIEIPEKFEGRHLFAVVLHMGIVWGGHYALAVKRYGKWYIKDDESVTELKEPPTKGRFYMAWYRP
jgi:ubiquitin C-terminal hydrolase